MIVNKNNIYLVPWDWKPEIKENYSWDDFLIKCWDLFANKVSRNRYVKFYLLNKQKSICPVCGNRIYNADHGVVHCCDYDRICTCPDEAIEYYDPDPSLKEVNRFVKIPYCEGCDRKEDCLSVMVMVHKNCNADLYETQKRIRKHFSTQKEFLKSVK